MEIKPEFKAMYMGEIPASDEFIEWWQSLFDFEETVGKIKRGIEECLENGDDLFCVFDVLDECCELCDDYNLTNADHNDFSETYAVRNYYTYKRVKAGEGYQYIPIKKIFTVELDYTLKGSLGNGDIETLSYNITKH